MTSKFKSNLGRGAASILVGLSLMGLAGCATTGSYAVESNNMSGEKFYDLKEEYRLVGKNNDVYLEKEDGTESKQVTYTPKMPEQAAFFSKDGKKIVYLETIGLNKYKEYKINIGLDEKSRKEISIDEYNALISGHN